MDVATARARLSEDASRWLARSAGRRLRDGSTRSGVRGFVGEDEGRISSCEQVFPRFTYGLEGYGGAPWSWTCVNTGSRTPVLGSSRPRTRRDRRAFEAWARTSRAVLRTEARSRNRRSEALHRRLALPRARRAA